MRSWICAIVSFGAQVTIANVFSSRPVSRLRRLDQMPVSANGSPDFLAIA